MKSWLLAFLALFAPVPAPASSYFNYPAAQPLTGTEIIGPVRQGSSDTDITSGQLAALVFSEFSPQEATAVSTQVAAALQSAQGALGLQIQAAQAAAAAAQAAGQTAAAQAAAFNIGQKNGVAQLDANALVPVAQINPNSVATDPTARATANAAIPQSTWGQPNGTDKLGATGGINIGAGTTPQTGELTNVNNLMQSTNDPTVPVSTNGAFVNLSGTMEVTGPVGATSLGPTNFNQDTWWWNPTLKYDLYSSTGGTIAELDSNNFSALPSCNTSGVPWDGSSNGCTGRSQMLLTGISYNPSTNANDPISEAIEITGDPLGIPGSTTGAVRIEHLSGILFAGAYAVRDKDVVSQDSSANFIYDAGYHASGGITLAGTYPQGVMQVYTPTGFNLLFGINADGSTFNANGRVAGVSVSHEMWGPHPVWGDVQPGTSGLLTPAGVLPAPGTTTASAAASPGATTMTVTNGALWAPGMLLVDTTDSGNPTATVASVSGSTLTLASPGLTGAVTSGATIGNSYTPAQTVGGTLALQNGLLRSDMFCGSNLTSLGAPAYRFEIDLRQDFGGYANLGDAPSIIKWSTVQVSTIVTTVTASSGTAGSNAIVVSSNNAAALMPGQVLADTTTAGAIPAGTLITGISQPSATTVQILTNKLLTAAVASNDSITASTAPAPALPTGVSFNVVRDSRTGIAAINVQNTGSAMLSCSGPTDLTLAY